MRTGPLAVAGWIVAAALTLGVSWSAVQVVRSAVTATDLTAADSLPVPEETGSAAGSGTAAPTPPAPSRTPGATSPEAGRPVSASGVGGTVVLRCVDGVPRFVSRIPRQGFSVDLDDSPGRVRFSSEDHRTDIEASCAGSVPRVEVEEKDESSRGRGSDDDDDDDEDEDGG